MSLKRIPLVFLGLIVAIIYFAGAELGLSLATLHSNVTAIWPPTGIAIASLLICGRRVWPGIFAGALAANLFTDIPVFPRLESPPETHLKHLLRIGCCNGHLAGKDLSSRSVMC